MGEPIRVLNIVGLMSPGGIETLIMNLYRNIDRNKVQFDFLTHKGIDGTFDEEIKSLGGRIYKMPQIREGDKTYYFRFFEYITALKRFFREHQEYHIVHGHMTNTAVFYMPIAKKYGAVTCCIAHSHQTQATPGLSGVLTNILQKPLPKIATDYFACSEMAAKWIFPEEAIKSGKVKVIRNGVDPKRFYFDEKKRSEVRKELGIGDCFVIGNVARFKTVKNHAFQIDTFDQYHKVYPNSMLMLIGEGELMNSMKEKVKQMKLEDSVLFMGLRSDVSDLMQAMDLFFLPSLNEGLPVVAVEAQAMGLPVLTSTGVPEETDITGNVKFLDLDNDLSEWIEAIEDCRKSFNRKDMRGYIHDGGYDITETAKWLEEFYLSKQ